MTDSAALLARLLPSLGLIVGGLLLVRWWSRRNGRASGMEPLRVTRRAALGRSAAAAVLHVEGRRFLLGMTEQSVSLLAELDPEISEATTDLVALDATLTDAALARAADNHTDHHPRTGMMDRIQRATARRPVDTSWRRVDRAPG